MIRIKVVLKWRDGNEDECVLVLNFDALFGGSVFRGMFSLGGALWWELIWIS